MRSTQILRRFAAMAVGSTLFCAALCAGQSAPSSAPVSTSASPSASFTSKPTMAVLLDPKRAQRDVEAGDKATAEGRFDAALAAYDDAAKYAPQNPAILGKGATLRSQLVRAHTDNAEQFAL